MIEIPCTLTCDSCGAQKEAMAKLDALSASLPMTPFVSFAYDETADGEDVEPWQVIHPGAKVACSADCHAKIVAALRASAAAVGGDVRPETVDAAPSVAPAAPPNGAGIKRDN